MRTNFAAIFQSFWNKTDVVMIYETSINDHNPKLKQERLQLNKKRCGKGPG